jgi:hypothetical protein
VREWSSEVEELEMRETEMKGEAASEEVEETVERGCGDTRSKGTRGGLVCTRAAFAFVIRARRRILLE